jgi:hypothetical protein
MTVLTGNQIDDARRLTLRAMLQLELKGLRRSRGPTAYAMLKSVYGYKGSREKVLSELDAWRNELLKGESK